MSISTQKGQNASICTKSRFSVVFKIYVKFDVMIIKCHPGYLKIFVILTIFMLFCTQNCHHQKIPKYRKNRIFFENFEFLQKLPPSKNSKISQKWKIAFFWKIWVFTKSDDITIDTQKLSETGPQSLQNTFLGHIHW